MVIISLIGGPGTGKSTLAADVFARLKRDHYDVELVTEYAKDLTWNEAQKVLQNQVYVFAKQQHRFWRLNGKVDIVVTDSPILLSPIYHDLLNSEPFPELHNLVLCEHRKFDNVVFYLKRDTPYIKTGRNQTIKEAKQVDSAINMFLMKHSIPFHKVEKIKTAPHDIYEAAINELKERGIKPI